MSDKAYLTNSHKKSNDINSNSQIKGSTNDYAELHSFDFNHAGEKKDWMAAKAEIDNLLQRSKSGSELLKKIRKSLITETESEPKEKPSDSL